jgi:hypothetical protein
LEFARSVPLDIDMLGCTVYFITGNTRNWQEIHYHWNIKISGVSINQLFVLG